MEIALWAVAFIAILVLGLRLGADWVFRRSHLGLDS